MGEIAHREKFADLAEAEAEADACATQFNQGMERFAVVIKAIRQQKLYLQMEGITTFAEYCEKRWGRTVRTVQRAIRSSDVRQKLLDASPRQRRKIEKLPTRELAKADPAKVKPIDFYSSPTPPPRRETDDQITARQIRAYAAQQPVEDRAYLLWLANQFHPVVT